MTPIQGAVWYVPFAQSLQISFPSSVTGVRSPLITLEAASATGPWEPMAKGRSPPEGFSFNARFSEIALPCSTRIFAVVVRVLPPTVTLPLTVTVPACAKSCSFKVHVTGCCSLLPSAKYTATSPGSVGSCCSTTTADRDSTPMDSKTFTVAVIFSVWSSTVPSTVKVPCQAYWDGSMASQTTGSSTSRSLPTWAVTVPGNWGA